MKKRIEASDLRIDPSTLPDGANYVFDEEKPVAVLMNIKYYKHIEYLMKELKKRITNE